MTSATAGRARKTSGSNEPDEKRKAGATVDRARKTSGPNGPDEKRIGRDGSKPRPRRDWNSTPPITSLGAAEIISGAEVTRLTGMTLTEAARAAERGDFPPPRRIAKSRWAWRREDVLNWLAQKAALA
jgi:predicted DNA-binding transcriptional regulator AlpA